MVDGGDGGGDVDSGRSWRRCEEFKRPDWLSLLDLSTGCDMLSRHGIALKGESFAMPLVTYP